MSLTCFHCGDAVQDKHYTVTILGQERFMCCPGCQAVATLITSSGLSGYYQHRTQPARNMSDLPEEIADLTHFDIEDIQEEFTKPCADSQTKETVLSIEGMNCAACAWLIERHLGKKNGIFSIRVNTASSRAIVKWQYKNIKFSEVLSAFNEIGYKAYPFQPIEQEKKYSLALQSYTRRMGVAGLAAMQVMMYTIALYMDIFEHMPDDFLKYFRWVSLLLTLPVVFYAAIPFYKNAWYNLKHGVFGMDIPVSLAIILAFSASFYATVVHQGQVYFESISMFVFFLLVGRFFEMRARRKAISTTANLARLIPTLARRLHAEGIETIPAKKLAKGDHIEVQAGSILPADGLITGGAASFDEAVLTGESQPLLKATGDQVFAGSLCLDQPVTIEVTEPPATCQATQILLMQENALDAKPFLATLADNIARYFVFGLLMIAAFTWLYWYFTAPEKSLWITLSVLVATCPCALSLATPTAFTCATQTLTREGILLKQNHVLETLAKVSEVFFDKTGTLTTGHMHITDIQLFNTTESRQNIINIAAALEQSVNHPIAHAITKLPHESINVENIQLAAGGGVLGTIQGKTYRIGHRDWFSCQLPKISADLASQIVYLVEHQTPIAAFIMQDQVRPHSQDIIKFLQQTHRKTIMLTGDPGNNVSYIAQQVSITEMYQGLSPEEKFTIIQQRQKQGAITMMVGDGVNDGPVLSAAHVSFAMAGGTDLAKNSADALLIGNNIGKIEVAFRVSQLTRRIILQNFCWAIGYNLCILPLAISGQIQPWMAALGMSMSSLIVMGNSLRLLASAGLSNHTSTTPQKRVNK